MSEIDLREVNPHLLDNLIQASEQEPMVVGEDIYDTRGIKLLATGYPLETSTREKLLFRKLMKPLETSIQAANVDLIAAIRAEVDWMLSDHPAVSRMFEGLDNEGLEIASTPMDSLPRLLLSLAYLNHDKIFKHAVLVAVLSRAIANKMGYDAAFVQSLTQAALAHDLGEMYLDPSFLYTTSRLSPTEWKATMVHPKVGSMLIAHHTSYGLDVATAVYEHHERENGNGYPRKLSGSQISPMGKILIVTEVLAGLLLKPSFPMRRANLVLKLVPNDYDKKVLDAVHQLAIEQDALVEEDHAYIPHENLKAVFNEVLTVKAMLRNYLNTPVSLVERELIEDALGRVSSIRRALSAVGLDYCMDLKNWESLDNDPQIRMEVDVAAREVSWRLRDAARDMLLNFTETGVQLSPELHTIVALMSQASVR